MYRFRSPVLRAGALVLLACLACSATAAPEDPVRLAFSELLEGSGAALRPSAKLLSMNGKRVRLAGYMARLESPPPGLFYLCPRPTFQDEGGAGTGDLPPEVVRVVVPWSAERALAFVPHAVEVVGILDLGYREEPEGAPSWIRLTLDPVPKPQEKEK